jgi:amino acid transporter
MAEGEVIFVRKATGLVRTAGVVTTAAISFGYLTQGITYYPSMDVYWFPGLNMPIAYGLAGFIMIWPLFIAIFLTQAMPRSASDYVAVARIVNPTISYIGTLIQWQNWAWVATATAPGIVQCFGQACVMYGKMTGNTSLVALMQPIATFGTNVLLAVSIISLIVFALLCIVGMRISGWVLNIMFAGMLVGVVLGTASLVWYALQGQAATAAAWDRAYGAGAWKEIEDVAIANGWRNYVEKSTGDPNMWGWPGKWDWSMTLAGVLPACYAWWGMELANQVAGEIKEPSKTYPTAMAIVLVIATIWYMLTASCMMMAFGEHYPMYVYNLIEGYSANYKINPEVFPMTTFFTGSISGNPALAFIIHFLTGLNLPSGALACFIVCSRVIFALSFDRVFPSIFARVNDRWRTPHWAIALTVIYGLLWLPVYVYLPYVAAWNTYASCALRYMFMGWAALIMPYKFPDLYERGYPYRIAGIPLLTIIGLFGTVTSTWLFVNNIVNIGGEVASFESTMVQVFWITFSVVLWSFFYNYRKSKGIDMDKLYQEIPPA